MKDLRTVPRYFLDPPLPGLANDIDVRIVDLGAKGGRFELARPMTPGTPIDVTIGTVHLKATVLWCQVDTINFAADYDGYLAGVAFGQPSEAIESLVEDLHSLGRAVRIEERRAHDRFRITAPLTGDFGDVRPISIIDICLRGVRLASLKRIAVGYLQVLRFQISEEMGPIEVKAQVMWCKQSSIGREYYAGLEIEGCEEKLLEAIDILCTRNEARIDIDSLRRKFDAMRLATRLTEKPQQIAV